MHKDKAKEVAYDTLDKIKKMKKQRYSEYHKAQEINGMKKVQNDSPLKSKGRCIEVNDSDVVALIKTLVDNNKDDKVTVLNFASARHAGGGFLNGARAQEEAICRASDLYLYLDAEKDFYNNPLHYKNGLYDSDMIYSKDVSLIKDSLGNDLPKELKFDVITSCAVNVRFIKEKGHTNVLNAVEPTMSERIESILELALQNNTDILILGAFGCGVFQNSPYVVKNLFERYLNRPRYKNKFKKVYFAIYGDKTLLNVFKTIRG